MSGAPSQAAATDWDAAGPASAILRAISDPGAVLPRLSGEWGLEPLAEWQTRAVLAAAASRVAAAERERIKREAEVHVTTLHRPGLGTGPAHDCRVKVIGWLTLLHLLEDQQ